MAADKVRHPVAQGGLWNTAKVQYSPETQKMLKEMMKESRLTNFQQRQLNKVLNDGKCLPPECNPTSSAKPRKLEPPTKKNNSAVIDPRKYQPRLRTQDKIQASGAYNREVFKPSPLVKYGGFYEKDKARLANIMAYGEDIPPPDPEKRARLLARQKKEEPEIDRFDELQKEVEERQKFMEEMESIGQGDKFRTIINTEISQLVREMEIIDKKRTAELSKMIEADERRRKKLYEQVPELNS